MDTPVLHMPDAATLERLRSESPEEPVVLLNPLKYREPGGRDALTIGAAMEYSAPHPFPVGGSPNESRTWISYRPCR